MSDKTSLGDRQKYYEKIPSGVLMPKVPVIARIDGKAFHTLTRKMEKPFDKRFQLVMLETAKYLCEQIQGVKLAYVQSDEISLLLTDTTTIKTQSWFNYEIQKMCSIAASMATSQFVYTFIQYFDLNWGKGVRPAFDARFWNLPYNEVTNYFIWRQQDATRNSIQSLARANFSHSQCNNLDCHELQDKLWKEKSINWNDQTVLNKRGACVRRVDRLIASAKGSANRKKWEIDLEIPIFTQNRDYIEDCLKDET